MTSLKEVFQDRIDAIHTAKVNYQNNPFSPDHTHDFRLALRKARSIVQFLQPEMEEEQYEDLNSQLSEAGKVLSDLRDLDVLYDRLAKLAFEEPELIDNYYGVFHEIDIVRRKEMRRSFNKTNQAHFEDSLAGLEALMEDMEAFEEDHDLDKFTKKGLKNQAKSLEDEYDQLDLNESEIDQVHQVRKDAKKTRYVSKYMGDLTEKKTKKYRKRAKMIQDDLGQVMDDYTIQETLQILYDQVDKPEIKDAISSLAEHLDK